MSETCGDGVRSAGVGKYKRIVARALPVTDLLYGCSLTANAIVAFFLACLLWRFVYSNLIFEHMRMVETRYAFRNFLREIEVAETKSSVLPTYVRPAAALSQDFSTECDLCASSSSSSCRDSFRKEVYLAVMSKSLPSNVKQRHAFRRMWDETVLGDFFYSEYVLSLQVHFSFVVGKAHSADRVEDAKIEEHMAEEADMYRDMVVGDFIDSPYNSTCKLLWILNYVRSNIRFQYLLVMNDDSFVNIFSVLQWLPNRPNHGFYAGATQNNGPTRSRTWYIQNGFDSLDTFPPYNMGFGYVLSCDVVQATLKYLPGFPTVGTDQTALGLIMFLIGVNATNVPRFAPFTTRDSDGLSGDRVLVIGNVDSEFYMTLTKDIMFNYLNVPMPAPIKVRPQSAHAWPVRVRTIRKRAVPRRRIKVIAVKVRKSGQK